MANRLTSLIALMILSCIFLVQFQFDLDPNNSYYGQQAISKPGGAPTEHESKKCKKGKKLTGSDVSDCQINKEQSFCQAPVLVDAHHTVVDNAPDDAKYTLPYNCQGPEYNNFGIALRQFANDVTTHGDFWGRREYGIPSHKTVLMVGNADTQQIAHSLACQHVGPYKIESVQVISKTTTTTTTTTTDAAAAAASDENAAVSKPTVQKIRFSNNATLVIITDDDTISQSTGERLPALIEQETGIPLAQYDGMVWGLLQDCGAVSASCPNTTQPLYFAAAQVFAGPMLFIGMMADARSEQSLAIRDQMKETHQSGPKKLWFISGRRYISKIKLEGATIYGQGEDADNVPKTGRYGHRCTGLQGGHADLLAFDVTEFLYHQLFYLSGK